MKVGTPSAAMRWVFATLLALLFVRAASAAPGPARSWADAQADEAHTLRAERDALRKALSTTKASTATAKASLRKDIDALAGQLTRLQVRNAALEKQLPEQERQRSSASAAVQLQDILSRMAASLTEELPNSDDDQAAKLPQFVSALLARAQTHGRLYIDHDAAYFDQSGQQVNAPVLHLGRVAAIRWDEHAVALVNTPEGLRELEGIHALGAGHGDVVLAQTVLFDPADPPRPDAFVEQGWRAKMRAGGPVMWALLVIGVIAGTIVIERTFSLLWARQRWHYEQRRFADAVQQAHTSTLLHVAGWIAKPLVIAAAARCPSCSATVDVDVEERATQALMIMREQLQRRLSLVNVAAGVAPLLGLLGTVTGMIHTFSVVTDTGTAEPQLLAAGISEALLTTQFGLAIAIPAYLAHALLSRGARRILASAEQSVLAYLHGGDGHGHEHSSGHAGHHHHHEQDPSHALPTQESGT